MNDDVKNMGPNDPYNEMQTAQDEIRPDFQNGGEKGKKASSAVRKAVAAKKALGGAEKAATSKAGKSSGALKDAEEKPKGLFTGIGKGKSKVSGKGPKLSIGKFSAAAVILMVVGVMLVAVTIIGGPLFTIGNIDYNLQDALGFTATTEILKMQASYIIDNKLAEGEIPDVLAGDLAAHGLEVGQVTLAGDFVRTNVYVADIENLKDLAVLGHFETTPSEGQLAILYDGEVIKAGDFVNAVESNMKLFADYSDAIDITAKYYYSNEVGQVYMDMGISRSAFANWKDTGDAKKNQESFEELAKALLDNNSNVTVNAVTSTGDYENVLIDAEHPESGTTEQRVGGAGSSEQVSGGKDASQIVNGVAGIVHGDNANAKAAQLLNAAISAGEPYLAASAFMVVEEPIQQARIEGNGPVNELLNMLNEESMVTYVDVANGDTKTAKSSIMTTGNFVSAISGGEYSLAEAANYSRDRGLIATKMSNQNIIKDTTIASNGQNQSNIAIFSGSGDKAEYENLKVLDDSVDMAMVQKNSNMVKSEVGGNRIVEGGSFLSNTLNMRVLGAMPSDEATIAGYYQEVKEVLARKAESERATKSPFDMSSPYTFMGSIAYGLASALARNNAGSGSLTSTVVGTIADMTEDSANGLFGSAVADGKDKSYMMTFGSYCDTAKAAANVKGDIYCTPQTTISTGYMKNSEKDWKNDSDIKNSLDSSGNIEDKSGLGQFVAIGMDRWSTVGVRSAEACEKWKQLNRNLATTVGDFFANMFDLYDSCGGLLGDDEVLDNIGTGAYYTMSGANTNSDKVKKYSAYVLYDEVSSLLSGTVSKVSQFRESYYAKYPQDNSQAGRIARISGMTKAEAETALAYADYLTMIAKYNPAQRYAFGIDFAVDSPDEPLVEHASQVAVDLYVMWHGKTEYDDLRNRVRVA